VAVAALERLGLTDRLAEVLDVDVMVPQVGQGALAVECRVDDEPTRALLAAVEHPPSRRRVDAERAFLARLGGGCDLPVGALADGVGPFAERLTITAVLADDRGVRRDGGEGADPVALGRDVAERLLAR
jgi:hydroxymethylbilane synthase